MKDERAALFWDCGARPDDTLRLAVQRLHRHGCDFAGTDEITQLVQDPAGLFLPGKTAPVTQWRDAVEFAEHWDGLSLTMTKGRAARLELLRAQGRLAVLLHEPGQDYAAQQAGAEAATRWAGLLIDLFEAAQARLCLFPAGLRGLPAPAWEDHIRAQQDAAPLLIARQPGTARPELRHLELRGGARLSTSLPVKAAP